MLCVSCYLWLCIAWAKQEIICSNIMMAVFLLPSCQLPPHPAPTTCCFPFQPDNRRPAKKPQRHRKGRPPRLTSALPPTPAGAWGISKGTARDFSALSWPNPQGKSASRLPPPSSGFRGRQFPLPGLGYQVTTPHAVAGRQAGAGSRAPGGGAGKARGPGRARTLRVQSPAWPL